MSKIQRVSGFFRVIFQIAFVLIIAFQILTWVYAPASLYIGHENGFNMIPENYFVNFAKMPGMLQPSLSLSTKLLCFMVNMIPTSILLYMVYSLIKLFRLYQQGEIFTALNVHYIRNVGLALLFGQLISPIYQGLIGVALTFQNASGQRFAMFGISTTDLGIILISFLILLVSWIMAEGCQLREEQQLTV